jgi:hypothetical protein
MPISSMPLPGDEEPDSSSQVAWLRSLGDREALFQIMDGDPRSIQSLEAAEALAQLGDVRGLDHLIAILNDSRSGLRMEAAEILQDLGHPRGMRALREAQNETPSADRAAALEEVYKDLSGAATDELVAIWHENDRAEWTDLEMEIIESILVERLGKLPRRTGAPDEDQAVDTDVAPRIQDLWKRGEADRLRHILADDLDVRMRLQAAEALADLGDEDALDYLIDMLDEGEEEPSELAAEILDWLNLPRGNAALRDRGYEFETDGGNLIEAPEAQQPRATLPTAPLKQPVAAPQTKASESWSSRVPRMPGESAGPLRQEQGASSGASLAAILTGAVGGLIGFLITSVGLDLLGLKPFPGELAEWLEPSMVYWVLESLVIGGVSGTIARRAAQTMAERTGDEVEEQDARLVLGALIGGAMAAVAVGVLRFLSGD